MDTYTCDKCHRVLEEIGIPPQIAMLQGYANVVNTGGGAVPQEIKDDPFVYRGVLCPACDVLLCPDCAKRQTESCPVCGTRQELVPAYRPLLRRRVAPSRPGRSRRVQTKAERRRSEGIMAALLTTFGSYFASIPLLEYLRQNGGMDYLGPVLFACLGAGAVAYVFYPKWAEARRRRATGVVEAEGEASPSDGVGSPEERTGDFWEE